MEIKKTPKGFEVDGITFDTRDVAERYVKSLKIQEKADTAWLDEKIDYKFDPNEKNSSFKIFIEKIAQANSLNMTQLADRIGVKRQTLYNWMDGKVLPDRGNLDKIRQAFNVSQEEVTLATLDNFMKAYPDYIHIIQHTGRMQFESKSYDPVAATGNFVTSAIRLLAKKTGFGSNEKETKIIVMESGKASLTIDFIGQGEHHSFKVFVEGGESVEAKDIDELQAALTMLKKRS